MARLLFSVLLVEGSNRDGSPKEEDLQVEEQEQKGFLLAVDSSWVE